MNSLVPPWPLSCTRWAALIVTLIVGTAFMIGWMLYPELPDPMASHWGIGGQADGYMSKWWGTFLFPFIILAIPVLLFIVPRFDPLRENVQAFRKYYDGFIVLFTVFLFYLYALTLAYNLGWRFNMGTLLVPAFAALWYGIGVLLQHAKRNWFIGIRTPWTLSDERVWTETHRVGAKVFKVVAALMLLSVFLPATVLWYAILPLFILSALIPVVYSYVVWRRGNTSPITSRL